MAPNDREERRRMRQRGAGLGAIGGTNFGFTFGASALPSQPSSRRTPRRTPNADPLPAKRSSRRTPATSRRTPGARRSASAEPSTQRRSASAQPSAGKAQSAKTPQQEDQQSLFVTPSVIGKRKRTSAILEAPQESQEDELEQNDEEHRASARKGQAEQRRRISSQHPVTATPKEAVEGAEDELEQEDEEHVLSTKARMLRKSLEPSTLTASPTETVRRKVGRPRKSIPDAVTEPTSEAPVQHEVDTPVARKRGRPRKSDTVIAGQLTRRGRSKKSEATAKSVFSADTLELDEEEDEEGEEDQDELSPIAVKKGARRLSKPQRQKQSLGRAHIAYEQTPKGKAAVPDQQEDEEEIDEQEQEEEQEVEEEREEQEDEERSQRSSVEALSSSMPHRLKHPAVSASADKPQKEKTAKDASTRKRQKHSNDSIPQIPVTVYRLSNPRRQVDDDEDELTQATPITRLPTVNAVDILAQVTSEITARLSTSLINQATAEAEKPRRAELKRRSKIVDAFAVELADRLFDLTEAVDAGETLKTRLKAVLKEKVQLREEFLNVRHQREEIALRMDAVRRKHADAERARRKDEQVNEALFDIELAVQRGKEKARATGRQDEGPELGLEWMLQSVTTKVSSKSNGGGLLQKTKSFNAFLERAAGVLEGRI